MLRRIRSALSSALLIVAVFAAGLPGISLATQTVDPAIEATITGQIEAFARGDAKAAFSFAAPSIQRRFGNPENFMSMVLNGYPMVYRPSSVEFVESVPNGDESVMQAVRLSDKRGKVWIAFYNMVRVSDEFWRIAGVRMQEIQSTII